jgi:hypothetical protein
MSGVIDLQKGRREEDVWFQITGERFHWQNYVLQQVAGNLHWLGSELLMTNMHGSFRTGQIAGWADFHFWPDLGTEFAFHLVVAGLDLQSFIQQAGFRTNKVEGTLDGELNINSGFAEALETLQGNGRVGLHDGLIWDIPIFGVFSPVLNAIVPGLGSSRAKEATASFIITNGVLFSKDLEIRATAMRMQYQGTVDYEQHVDGRMEAELLRDVPAIGFLVSKLFWPVTKLFEYKIAGTLKQPKTEPLYVVPKLLLMPFHPFKTLKDLFPEGSDKPNTNSPPAANGRGIQPAPKQN